MSKLVYKAEDGFPIIIDENKKYEFEYTETPPPEGIYSPFYFNGVAWIGTSKEDYESENPPTESVPSNDERIKSLEETTKKILEEIEEIKRNESNQPQA